MSRKHPRPTAHTHLKLDACQKHCWICGTPLWVAYAKRRKVMTLAGLVQLYVPVRRCQNRACPRSHRPYRLEAEGHYALPHGEFGLDVIALVGQLRFAEHRSVPEIRAELDRRGVSICERSVTEQLYRYEELLALDGQHPTSITRCCGSCTIACRARSCARRLLSATEADLAALITAVRNALPVPIRGVISDGQQSIRKAGASALPDVPHQVCQFHYLREAAKPIYEADRHAKKELKKAVRGVRPIERALEVRDDGEAEAVRGYCLAVRSALTDDGRPPLCASGLKLRERLTAITTSIERVAAKRGACRASSPACTTSSSRG